MATTSLSRTMTAGDRDKFTVSAWVKRGILGVAEYYWSCYTDASNYTWAFFDNDNTLHWYNHVSGAAGQQLPTRLFRDPGAWYHIVTVWDSAASAADRMRIYVNGDEVTTFLVDSNPSSGQDSSFGNSGTTMYLGQKGDSSSYFGGSLAHVHVCDGQAYAASDFCETDATSGIWIAKTSPSVTYGTNGGFYKFVSGATLTDSSGESNNLTLVGGTLTTTKDNPDNNFCTMNSIGTYGSGTLSNGNTSYTSGAAAWRSTMSTIAPNSGKWYMEMKYTSGDYAIIGIAGDDCAFATTVDGEYVGENTPSIGYIDAGVKYINGSSSSYGNSYSTGDIVGMALDLDNNFVYFSKNGTWQDSGDPTSGATGTGGITIATTDTDYFLGVTANNGTVDCNFGNGYFGTTAISTAGTSSSGDDSIWEHDCPTGFYGLNTKNLGSYS